jgi:CheY-like chemotaxis protein
MNDGIQQEGTTRIRKMRQILLIEDEERTRRSISMVLENEGFMVKEAANGLEALDVLMNGRGAGSGRFDLLLTDIVMPEMTGLEFIDRIKKAHLSLPIIVISGYRDNRMMAQLVKLGCPKFLDKPFEADALMDCVNEVLVS